MAGQSYIGSVGRGVPNPCDRQQVLGRPGGSGLSEVKPRLTIGGDFELTTLNYGDPQQLATLTHGFEGTWTSSGRSALALVLQQLTTRGINHVHLPSYLCESIIAPIEALNLDYSFYPVDSSLTARPEPPAGAAVLIINYFGWLNPAMTDWQETPPEFVLIEDCCQALLSGWNKAAARTDHIILSPRKFAGTALGGWCNTPSDPVPNDRGINEAFQQSLKARMLRGSYLSDESASVDSSIESTYLSLLAGVESFLDENPTNTGLPDAALRLIAGMDWKLIAERRRSNWLVLHEQLHDQLQPIFETLPDDVVPLGYEVRVDDRDRIREQLAKRRIFCPVHWPLPKQVNRTTFPQSAELAATALTLPVDQRYTSDDMSRLAEAIADTL